jgi:hypothetical protein
VELIRGYHGGMRRRALLLTVLPALVAFASPQAFPPRGGHRPAQAEGGLTRAITVQGGITVEGLHDGKRVLIPAQPTADERASVCGGGSWLERQVDVRHVDDDWISVQTTTRWWCHGAAHSHQEVDCATWHRRSGRRLKLAELLGPAVARQLRRRLGVLHQDEDQALALMGRKLPRTTFSHEALLIGSSGDLSLCFTGPDEDAEIIRLADLPASLFLVTSPGSPRRAP